MEEEEIPMVKLLAPAGTGSVGFEGVEYPVDETGGVSVPAAAGDALKSLHGFADYSETTVKAGRKRKAE